MTKNIIRGVVMRGGSKLYGPGIVRSGLILYLDAGNTASYPGTGTTWTDLSGNNNNGTLINGPTYSSANGGSIVFDGSNDYVNAPLSTGYPAAMTVITVGKSNNATWNHFGGLGSGRLANGYIIHNNQSQTSVEFYLYDSSSTYLSLIGTTPSSITNYNMYSITTNGSNEHITYLNNTSLATNTTSITRTNTGTSQDNYLGRDMTFTRYNAVTIGLHMIYNRALTAAEISQNFNALKLRFGI
jgi:hypothetical protein